MNFRYLLAIFLLCFFCDISSAQSSANKQLLKRARKGDVSAMRQLGKKLVQGDGLKRDVTNGVKWLKMAAEHGDSGAMLLMGDLHRLGTGAPKNINMAVKYYQQAAAAGNTTAAERLKKIAPEAEQPQQQTEAKQKTATTTTTNDSSKTDKPETPATDTATDTKAKKAEAKPAPRAAYPPIFHEFQKAVERGEYWKYEDFIAKGVDINLPLLNRDGLPEQDYTALHRNVLYNDYEGAKILIKHGANINLRYSGDERIWVYAMRDKDANHPKRCEFILWLLDNNISLEPSTMGKETLMHVAVMCSNYEVVSYLLKRGNKIDTPREGGITPATDVAIWLLQAINSLEINRQIGASLIPHIEQKLHMLSELLKAGANPNIPGTYQFDGNESSTRTAYTHTVLRASHIKNSHYYYELCNLLTRYGANPRLKNKDGLNALEELILHNADYDITPGNIAEGTCRELILTFIKDNVTISNPRALARLKEDGELYYLYKQKHPEVQ